MSTAAPGTPPAPDERRPGRPGDLVLRLTLGPAFVIQRGWVAEERVDDYGYGYSDDYGGNRRHFDDRFVGQTGEISLGSVQIRRVIVGGSLMETVGYNDSAGVVVVSFGTYVDYYPISERGFHLRADISTGVMAGLDDTKEAMYSLGALVGAGYDTWISEGWALGVLARLQYVGGFHVNQMRHLFIPTISLSASYGPISW